VQSCSAKRAVLTPDMGAYEEPRRGSYCSPSGRRIDQACGFFLGYFNPKDALVGPWASRHGRAHLFYPADACGKIAEALNARGIATARGGTWAATQVADILKRVGA
jgi:Recombinase